MTKLMTQYLMGRKRGMTQIFDDKRNVVPATVINLGRWFVCQIKTLSKDGYAVLQVGLFKKKYMQDSFDLRWLKKKQKYFEHICEIPLSSENCEQFSIGQEITIDNLAFEENPLVTVTGVSRGKGFQGVVKRHGFRGGPSSHGSSFHRRPGSIGNMCSQGNVIKGKKLPGHMGVSQVTIKGLRLVRIDKENGCVFVRGGVPGHKNSLIFIRKQGQAT